MTVDDLSTSANRAEAGDVRAAIRATLAAIAPETDLKSIAPDRPLREQIDLDSVDWLNVMVGLCERLAVDIPESDYERLATLDSIAEYIAARRPDRDGARTRVASTASLAELPCTRHRIRGTVVTVRPMRAGDAGLETDFVDHLSHESRYERFMVTLRELPQSKLRYLTNVDQVRHVALVATVERDGQDTMIGVVRYVVDGAGTGCEFAIAIDDDWKGSGLAGVLMLALMNVARGRGLETMEGSVLAINSRMLKFMRQLGFRQEREPDDAQTVRVVRAL
jgi:acyl carrier protein/RimJ/RimL family protein N-acetyltransferase